MSPCASEEKLLPFPTSCQPLQLSCSSSSSTLPFSPLPTPHQHRHHHHQNSPASRQTTTPTLSAKVHFQSVSAPNHNTHPFSLLALQEKVLLSDSSASTPRIGIPAYEWTVHVSVTNEGGMDGSHVIVLFSQYLRRSKAAPQKQLVGFERVHVPASQSTEATLLLEPCVHLSTADEKGKRVLPLGPHVLMLESGAEHSIIIKL